MRSLSKLCLVGAVAALLIAAGLALNSGSVKAAPEDDVRATVQAAVDAWNAGDAPAFLKLWTDQGLMDEFGFASREEAEQALPEFIGEPPIALISLEDVRVFSGNASGDLTLAVGGFLDRDRQDFLFLDRRWQLHTAKRLSPVPAAGTSVVGMNLREFAFVYDKSAVASGNFAIRYDNVGGQAHEIALVKLNTDVPLRELIMSEEEPEGIELIDIVQPILPGESGTLVFTEPLSAGNYGFICFFPDTSSEEGTPHAFLGMTSEFTVGGGISPPSTGGGGLASGSFGGPSLAYALLLLLLAPLTAVGVWRLRTR